MAYICKHDAMYQLFGWRTSTDDFKRLTNTLLPGLGDRGIRYPLYESLISFPYGLWKNASLL